MPNNIMVTSNWCEFFFGFESGYCLPSKHDARKPKMPLLATGKKHPKNSILLRIQSPEKIFAPPKTYLKQTPNLRRCDWIPRVLSLMFFFSIVFLPREERIQEDLQRWWREAENLYGHRCGLKTTEARTRGLNSFSCCSLIPWYVRLKYVRYLDLFLVGTLVPVGLSEVYWGCYLMYNQGAAHYQRKYP